MIIVYLGQCPVSLYKKKVSHVIKPDQVSMLQTNSSLSPTPHIQLNSLINCASPNNITHQPYQLHINITNLGNTKPTNEYHPYTLKTKFILTLQTYTRQKQ